MRTLLQAGVGLEVSHLHPATQASVKPADSNHNCAGSLTLRQALIDLRVLSSIFMALLMLGALLLNSAVAAPKSKLIEYWQAHNDSSVVSVDHRVWQGLLHTYVHEDKSGMNMFDYSGVTELDFSALQKYLLSLQAMDPRVLSRDEQFAYWVNLYNAKTVELVVEAVQERGITSIKQIKSNYIWSGPWSMNALLVDGNKMSLNDVEHGVLRPIWQDHRIHYAVNCASIGCPNLQKNAFTASNSEALLQQAESQFLAHPRGLSYENGVVHASKIFSWYQSDFAKDKGDLLNYFRRFIELDAPNSKLKIVYNYDWALNSPD